MEHRARYRGVTLIEAVLFISIAMGIIVGGLQFYQQASTALRTEQTVRLATSLVAETHSLYRGSDIPAEAARARIDPTLVAAGGVVATALSGDPAAPIQAPWGGAVTLDSGTGRIDGTAGPLSLHLTFNDMPTTICTRVLKHDASASGPMGSGVIETGIVDLASGNPVVIHSTEAGGALSPSDAGVMCGEAGNGTAVVMSFGWRSN
ncbi:MAG TPA: hypothetical protein DDY29_08560 [Rhodobacteraceae bacterium]|nr:hypothetical protein [Paracoccaceae bacterium]HBG98759.1 hypothetical protein [Paracoccaceae bacterium]